MRTHRLAVVDEHQVFRRGVIDVLQEDSTIEVVHDSDNGRVPEADIVIASPVAFQRVQPDCPVMVCWGPSDPPLDGERDHPFALVERDTVRCADLLATVRALAAGLRLQRFNGDGRCDALDARDRHILQMLAEGADTRGIAESLFYSERSVKGMIRDIEERLCARNRAQAVAKGIRLGLI